MYTVRELIFHNICVSTCIFDFFYHVYFNTGHGLSGQFCKQRQEHLQIKLEERFEECDGKEVEQSIILHYLGLSDTEKSLATRAVTSTFPSYCIQRVMRSCKN